MPSPCMIDVWTSPAWPLLVRLEADGFTFHLEGMRVLVHPAGRLTVADRRELKKHRDAVRLLLTWVLNPDIQERLERFNQQMREAPPGGLPAFVFKPETPYLKGSCFSCGRQLTSFTFGRCEPCSIAWRLAAGVPISSEFGAAVDTARIAS